MRGVGTSTSSTPGASRQDLRRLLRRDGPLELGVDRQRVPGEDRHAHARHRHGQVGDPEDLAALVAELLLLVGLTRAVVDDRAGEGEDVEGDRRRELLGGGELDGAAVEGELGGPIGDLAHLGVELVDTDPARARHRLVGRHDEPAETGGSMQRAERRHRRHRGAVRVGDDALGDALEVVGVDLADDERHVGIHAPRRRVVDDGRAALDHLRRQLPRRVLAVREQRQIEPGERRRGGVLDLDLGVAPRQALPGGPGRREVPDLRHREAPLVEQPAHDPTDLTGRSEHPDTHGAQGYEGAAPGPKVVAREARRNPRSSRMRRVDSSWDWTALSVAPAARARTHALTSKRMGRPSVSRP